MAKARLIDRSDDWMTRILDAGYGTAVSQGKPELR